MPRRAHPGALSVCVWSLVVGVLTCPGFPDSAFGEAAGAKVARDDGGDSTLNPRPVFGDTLTSFAVRRVDSYVQALRQKTPPPDLRGRVD